MRPVPKIGSPAALSRRAVVPLLMLALTVALAAPAAASQLPRLIVLPGAGSAEGIAAGRGATFFAGDLFRGDIFRGNLRRGTAEMFIDVPEGRMAVGMAVDRARRLLFVAGGFTGQGYVYDTRTKATLATYQFANPQTNLINDVVVTKRGAWFTDSKRATLYFVPIGRTGVSTQFRTLALSGPAADTRGEFNLNGIQAVGGGKTLIVAHSANGRLYRVDSRTGASATIAGVRVPTVDGIVLRGRRLWAVQNSNRVTRVRLSPRLRVGVVERVIRSDRFQVPSTATRYGRWLAVVNAKFDTGIPPTADRYEVVIVRG
jgi:sugar lactone lactonase YvrE